MCGRYTLTTDGSVLADEFGIDELASWTPRFNIAPTQLVAAIVRTSAGPQAAKLHWGLVPGWAKDRKTGARAINARAETVAEKPTFRAAFRMRRCLVLADGYYEWVKHGERKQPYYITPQDGRPFAFAGLWERWSQDDEAPYYSCTVITCEASADLAELHHRMPVTLARSDFFSWLDPDTDPARQLEKLTPAPAGTFTPRPVSTIVNSPANDDHRCIEANPA
ncbi:MAG: SOS response-associated peptidase [Gammaproteobacteria bacterium]|jgi:putative SOS response-associated peptidase YedK